MLRDRQAARREHLAHSEVGHGTSFKIYLPWVEEATAPAPASPDAAGAPPGDEVVLLDS